MRFLIRLFWAFLFFCLFAFALNNQQAATVNWFFGLTWQAPLVIIVLVTFVAGTVFGVLAMTPAWWHHRRVAKRQIAAATPAAGPAANPDQTPVIPDGL
ncbi:MAG: hypothetical protein CFE46_19290 [Burkholderiales bacterium PBB6]|jgi:putative membrane protein|uniref:LapA family protein n=1 Tax=Ideonella margarita TaxID=2984191 RepID=A0ABU9C911_9BURK|nr:MAG: hypothetical protein CFE46_19290 [Burkholderiales bacterium PBB6]